MWIAQLLLCCLISIGGRVPVVGRHSTTDYFLAASGVIRGEIHPVNVLVIFIVDMLEIYKILPVTNPQQKWNPTDPPHVLNGDTYGTLVHYTSKGEMDISLSTSTGVIEFSLTTSTGGISFSCSLHAHLLEEWSPQPLHLQEESNTNWPITCTGEMEPLPKTQQYLWWNSGPLKLLAMFCN